MKNCFAYLRVSTPRQGIKGVSLQEQRDDITAYAHKHDLKISQWFEERESAAKYGGRPVFADMVKKLKAKKAGGIIFHKIDRSSRNMSDWAALEELHDAGFEIHFTVDNLDLHSLGDRMVAGIQAVMAANYSRNLRQEARKGFKGRLKQGIYPLAAPMGYLDMGGGNLKEIDPVNGPLMRKAFELYATGEYTLDDIRMRLKMRTKRKGTIITKNALSVSFKNPFYIGILKIKSTGETYKGKHEPLISQNLFNQVQNVLAGKVRRKETKHSYLFSRTFKCCKCSYTLTPELQKGIVYYRCHTKKCLTKTIREVQLSDGAKAFMETLTIDPVGLKMLKFKINQLLEKAIKEAKDTKDTVALRQSQISDQLNRLTDLYVEGALEKEVFEERRVALLVTQDELTTENSSENTPNVKMKMRVTEFFELLESFAASQKIATDAEKVKLLKSVTSNRMACPENVEFKPRKPWQHVQNFNEVMCCGGTRSRLRTETDELAKNIFKFLQDK